MASKYGNPRGQAATDAKRKYNSKNYDRIYPYVKKGKKSVYQRAAKASGFDSINDMIESLMDERAAAVLGLSPEQFAGKRLLLVDDICTTGATLGECARVLKAAGAAEVLCLTLAMVRE